MFSQVVNDLDKLHSGITSKCSKAKITTQAQTFVAIAESKGNSSTNTLDLVQGDCVILITRNENGWCWGRKTDGKEGWFSPHFVANASLETTAC